MVRQQDNVTRENGIDILERLVNIMASGQFTMTDDVNDCKFCEFKSVCRRECYDKDVFEQKQMDAQYEALRRFKGVRAYD